MKSISERRCQGVKELMGRLSAQNSLRESVCALSVRLVLHDVNDPTGGRQEVH